MGNPVKIELDELKKLELLIMDQIVLFCDSHNLRYYLTGGSLLGAVRHNGFIPWDDDIDIAMPRNDYEVFTESFNNEVCSRYKVVNYKNTKGYYLPFAKVVDTRTVLKEHVLQNSFELGVYVDVFPIDFCGDDREVAWRHYKTKIQPLRKAISMRDSKMFVFNQATSFKRIKWYIGRFILQLISRASLLARIDLLAQKYRNSQHSKYCAVLTVMTYGEKEIMLTEWYNKTVKLQFEDRMFNAPLYYKNVLEHFYNNYLKLPPNDKQVSHHSFDVFWRE